MVASGQFSRDISSLSGVDREDWEVYDYEKRLDKRFMADKSGRSVYIGNPEAFAEWAGYTVEELLTDPDGADETDAERPVEASDGDASDDSEPDDTEETESAGFLSRLFG